MAALQEAADDGRNLIVVTDDAYFGLFYGDELAEESLFARLVNLHDRILAVKVNGPTKEEFVWGLRTGMLTFSTRAFSATMPCPPLGEEGCRGDPQHHVELFARHPDVLVKALSSDSILEEREQKKGILEARADRVSRDSCQARVRQVLGTVPFQQWLFHVREAQGPRRRRPSASTCWRSTAWA